MPALVPGSLLLDAGGGWFDAEDVPMAGVFGDPELTLSVSGSSCRVHSGSWRGRCAEDPFRFIEDRTAEGYTSLGYLSFDYFRHLDFGAKKDAPKAGLPIALFHFYGSSGLRLIPCQEALAALPPRLHTPRQDPQPNITKEEFIWKVAEIKRQIAEGNVYQVNLSRRIRFGTLGDARLWFADFYRVQPVPYAALIRCKGFEVVSGSMELFLRRRGNGITTRPIKGTIRTDPDPQIDAELAEVLRHSPKERAENVMIVDLMRNDLGRICDTVTTPELFVVRRYSTLYQMESEVRGRLHSGIGLSEIIGRTFPPGSVTGAPKRTAVQLIDRLEPHRRGPYCGAIGLFHPSGDFTMSVAIRTGVNRPAGADFFFGSGIVWDSDAAAEYAETELKATALTSVTSPAGL